MANDRDQELERLERELLADISKDDDLLADIPIELLQEMPENLDDTQIFSDEELLNLNFDEPEAITEPPVEDVPMKQSGKNKKEKAKKREDRWLTTLMAIASFLCLGIIAVLIYWLEVFLK